MHRQWMPRLFTLIILTATSSFILAADAPQKNAPRDVNTHHMFTPPDSKDAWEKRAAELRQQMLFSTGLYPMPEKTPLNPRVTGTFEGADFFVDNVALETYPGFFLCGNLYRPKNMKGPFPAIANPHGHWAKGRLHIEPDVPKAEPAPAKPAPGKANLPAIGINLARQGIICFSYDMCGYNDTNQIPDHRKFCNGPQPWLWNVSLNGLQLWNSIRVVDYLESRPDVDKKRLGATGASGGGTQTFQLCAVDERIKCAVPVNMISAHMQGGCLCENAPGMRVDTDNPEIGSIFAPKPLLLIAATGDWTKNNPTEEWPGIKKVYDLYGAGDKTACQQFNYGHNYNIESREAMYAWFGRWFLKDTNPEHFREKSIDIDVEKLHVWNEKNPRPTDALSEAKLVESLTGDIDKRITALWPHDSGSLKHFQEKLRPALNEALNVRIDPTNIRTSAKHVVVIAALSEGEITPALKAELAKSGAEILPVIVPPGNETPESLWKDFFIAYNRTVAGERVQQIANVLTGLKQAKVKRIDAVGVGRAGLWMLLARGLVPSEGRTVVDVDSFANTDDKAFLEKLYSPGLRRAGDVKTAAMLIAPNALCLHNTGGVFKTDEIAKGYESVKAELRVEQKALSLTDIAAWLHQK